MKCLACGKEIRNRVTWQNLFREKKYFMCDNCYLKYPLDIIYHVLPIKEKMVEVFTLVNRYRTCDPEAYLLELSGLFKFILNKYDLNNCGFFYYDSFNDVLNEMANIEDAGLLCDKVIVLTTFV